ncbi:MAG TPA: ATP-binding protein [Pyrinomonadaceae bacterium]|nr:ATP-binding protein [Pyrinomonadaceae bacterium]
MNMTLTARDTFQRYGAAVFAVFISMGLRILLTPFLGAGTPFILLYPAVAFSALFGGTRAGLVTTFLGVIIADFFVMEPQFSFILPTSREFIQLIIFVMMGSFISWLVGDRQKVRTRLADAAIESERQTVEAERALRESKERSRLAESSASVGIWEWDLEQNRVEWSEGIYELLGIDPELVEPSPEIWTAAMVPDEVERAQTRIEKFINDGSPDFYDEFRLRRHSDGRIIWLATQGKIIREEGKAVRLFGVNYDITEIKEKGTEISELNKLLKRRVGELQTIFDLTPVGIAVAHDADCNVITANRALARMVGVEPGRNISSNLAELPYKHLKNGRVLLPHELPMQRAVAEKQTIINEELDIERADGKVINIFSYAAPVFDEDGQIVSCVAAQIDITERKQREMRRERALGAEQELRKEAEEASRLKDEFLATVSHELRTPLNSIIGWISMLRENTLGEEIHERAIAAVERGAKAQSQLIEDLLDISRITSGKLRLHIEQIDLDGIVHAAADTLRPAADAKEIVVNIQTPREPAAIPGDRDRMQQVVWNLMSNAIKFTPKGGRVEISLDRDESQIVLTVADTGKGISKDFLPLVFDRFRQADGSITRSFAGLGIGLSIVRHLVELHGGTVEVASGGENKGAKFTVRLPAILRESGPGDEILHTHADMSVSGLKGLRVLVVDDEEDSRDILTFVFKRYEADVVSAVSASDGLEKAKAWSPEVIISDIGMPGEDGYAFMKNVRDWETKTSRKAVPSIALTAYARSEDRERAIESGFHEHVAKPVEPAHLVRVVQGLIRDVGDPNA